jgi:hypothetical protein
MFNRRFLPNFDDYGIGNEKDGPRRRLIETFNIASYSGGPEQPGPMRAGIFVLMIG